MSVDGDNQAICLPLPRVFKYNEGEVSLHESMHLSCQKLSSSVLCNSHIKSSEFARIILRYFLQLQRYPALIHFVLFLSLIATSLVLLQQLSIMCSLQACNNVTECLF